MRTARAAKLHEAVEHLGAQHPVGADMLVRHVAGMRSVVDLQAVAGLADREVRAGRLEARGGVAFAGLVDVKAKPAPIGQPLKVKPEQHAMGQGGQRGLADRHALAVEEGRGAGGCPLLRKGGQGYGHQDKGGEGGDPRHGLSLAGVRQATAGPAGLFPLDREGGRIYRPPWRLLAIAAPRG